MDDPFKAEQPLIDIEAHAAPDGVYIKITCVGSWASITLDSLEARRLRDWLSEYIEATCMDTPPS